MSLLSKNSNPRDPVGLDVDSGYLAAVQASSGRIVAGASMELPDGLVVEGEVADVDGLGAALKEFFKENGLSRSVRLGVANQQVAVRELELPRIADEGDLAAAVRFKAEEAVPMPLDEAVLDHHVIGEGSSFEGAPTTRVMVVAARQAMVERLADAARAAGLKPAGIDLNAFALVRLLAEPSVSDEQARVYCHLAGVANIAVAVGSTCLFTRTLSVVPAAEAELAAAQLAEEIQPSIDYYLGQPGAKVVGDVVLSGPGASAAGLADALSPLLGVPVAVANPLGTLNRVGLPPGEDPQRHTIAAGLALGAAA